MTKIDGLEFVITEHIKSTIDKEIKKRFEELKPELAKRCEELLSNLDEVHLALASSENAAEVIQLMLESKQEENERLRGVIGDFFDGFEHRVFGELPNGNNAFGYDEGEVYGGKLLTTLYEKSLPFLNGETK